MKRALRRFGAILGGLLLLAVAGLSWVYTVRPGMDAVAAHAYVESAQPSPGPAVYATWFGTTGVLLEDGEHALLIDPFFSRPPGFLGLALNARIAPDQALIERWLAQAHVQKLDAVLVSHSHYDHAMDAGVVARLTGAVLVGSPSTANIGRGAGLPETQLRVVEPGRELQFGSFTVSFIASRHAGATGGAPTGDITVPLVPPARYLDYRQGGTYSILVHHAAGSVLHHGSANFVPGALAGQHADVVFLGIALLDDLPSYLHEVVDAVGARRVLPTHWDDFTRPLDQPLLPFPLVVRLDRFFADMAQLRPDLQVQTLQAGQRVRLLPN
jgi:L-ascorbate metabolism protein UlaG (beta-lactamase superfamily)